MMAGLTTEAILGGNVVGRFEYYCECLVNGASLQGVKLRTSDAPPLVEFADLLCLHAASCDGNWIVTRPRRKLRGRLAVPDSRRPAGGLRLLQLTLGALLGFVVNSAMQPNMRRATLRGVHRLPSGGGIELKDAVIFDGAWMNIGGAEFSEAREVA